MANWGDIAGGVNQGMARNVQTIAELQKMQHVDQVMDMEKNKFDAWKQDQEAGNKKIYLDTVDLPDHYKKVLYPVAKASGAIGIDTQGKEFIKARDFQGFQKTIPANTAIVSELAKADEGALLQNRSGIDQNINDLKAKLTKDPQNEKLTGELNTLLGNRSKINDELNMTRTKIDGYTQAKEIELKQRQIENEKRNMPSVDQVKAALAMKRLNGQAFTPEEDKLWKDLNTKEGGTPESITFNSLVSEGNKPIDVLRKISEAKRKEAGGGEGTVNKEVDRTAKQIETYRKTNYHDKIIGFERQLAAAKSAYEKAAVADQPRFAAEIDRLQNQIYSFQDEDAKALNTINQLRDGSISPGEVKWGGGNPKPMAAAKTVVIDGKRYKDGDIVTKDGKQFKVKVK